MGMMRFTPGLIYDVDRVIFAHLSLNQKKAPAAPQAPPERFFGNEHLVLDSRFFLLLAARCSLLAAYCSLLTAYCLLLTAYWLLLAAYYLLLAAYCLLLTACC